MKKIILIYLLCVLLSSSFALGIYDDDPDLLVWLKMDDKSGAMTDSSTGTPTFDFEVQLSNNDGVYAQSPVAPYSTHSYDWNNCDGTCSGFKNRNINDALGGTDACDFTIGFWYDGSPHPNSNRLIANSVDTTNTGWVIYHDYEQIRAAYYGVDGIAYMEVPIPSYTPTHILMTADNGLLSVYINEALKATDTFTCGNQPTSTDNLYIGWHYNDNYGFLGKMDELTIFNRSLSEEEITDLYKQGVQIPKGSDLIWYLMLVIGVIIATGILFFAFHKKK